MPREAFERKLRQLEDELLALGSMVEGALDGAVQVLKHRDMKRGQRLIADDRIINQRRYAIEAETLAVIATQQPTAGDLRTLAAILEIAAELERIGDYAKGIARINEMIGPGPLIKPLLDIPRMAANAREMLRGALDAFVRRDIACAQAIPAQDDIVDDLYNQVYRELMSYVINDPKLIGQANYLLWAAHNLERAADRVTNICERTVFTVTGRLGEMDPEHMSVVQ